MKITRVGVDLAKNVFHVESGDVVEGDVGEVGARR